MEPQQVDELKEIAKGGNKVKYVDTWDLDSIFPGGTKSGECVDNKNECYQRKDRRLSFCDYVS